MERRGDHSGEPSRIDAALVPIRAAISMVADGSARRVAVVVLDPETLIPAARLLGRAAGVRVEIVTEAGHADRPIEILATRAS